MVEVVECYIISIVSTSTGEIHIVVLTDACLEHLIKPIGVRVVLEYVFTRCGIKRIATGERCVAIGTGLTNIIAVLGGIHHIVDTLGDIVYSEISIVIDLQRLVFLSAFVVMITTPLAAREP